MPTDTAAIEALRDDLARWDADDGSEWNPPVPPLTTDRRAGCRMCRGGERDFVCHVCLEKQR